MKLAAKHRKAIRDAGPYTDRVGNVRRYDTAAMCSVALDTDQAMACVAALNAIASTPPVVARAEARLLKAAQNVTSDKGDLLEAAYCYRDALTNK